MKTKGINILMIDDHPMILKSYVDVLKDMDTLHNPPQALWEDTGEFSIYFSLIVNG